MKQDRNEKKFPAGFCNLTEIFTYCLTNSGSIEQVFSTYGLAWNKLSNLFGRDRAEKLVKVYRLLNTES